MLGIIEDVAKVLAGLIAFIMAESADNEKTGKEKKEEVIDYMQKLIDEFEEDMPDWLIDIVSNEKILGILIELLYKAIKTQDFLFPKTSGKK